MSNTPNPTALNLDLGTTDFRDTRAGPLVGVAYTDQIATEPFETIEYQLLAEQWSNSNPVFGALIPRAGNDGTGRSRMLSHNLTFHPRGGPEPFNNVQDFLTKAWGRLDNGTNTLKRVYWMKARVRWYHVDDQATFRGHAIGQDDNSQWIDQLHDPAQLTAYAEESTSTRICSIDHEYRYIHQMHRADFFREGDLGDQAPQGTSGSQNLRSWWQNNPVITSFSGSRSVVYTKSWAVLAGPMDQTTWNSMGGARLDHPAWPDNSHTIPGTLNVTL
ncbi:MAG: hypothetical protein AAFV53_13385 [Myxococcota bacterium]